MRKYLLILCLCTATSTALAYIVDGTRINQPRLLSFARDRLKNQGIIEQEANGEAYVKVPDQYIHDLIRQVKTAGFSTPLDGAYIQIIEQDEGSQIHNLAEAGKIIAFEPITFYTMVQDDKEYFMLAVAAPELNELRQKYGLSEKLANHEFNIIVGIRPIQAQNELAD